MVPARTLHCPIPRSAALPQSQSGGAGDARVASFPRWIANQQPEALVVVPFARRKVVFAHVILGRPGATTTCMGWAGSLP